MAQMFRLLKSGLVTSGPAQFHGRSPKGTLTFRQLEGQKTVLSSFEKFHPRDHCAAPGKPRPSHSIPGCAGHRARGRGTAVCAPQDRPRRATHLGPAFSNKMSPESRGRGATGRRLRPNPSPGGSEWGDTEYPGYGGRRGGESRFIQTQRAPPSRSPPAGCARRPQPPHGESPGRRALEGRGSRHLSRRDRPSAPGPLHLPTSAAGPRLQRPRSWPRLARGSRGSPRAPAQLRAPSGPGGGRAPPSPRTGGRNSQSEAQPPV